MSPQEVIISACASEASSSTASGRSTIPAIHAHDLLSSTSIHSFKTSVSALHCVSYVPSQHGVGGAVFAVQEGKALAHVWAWQKDQMHVKLHLPEKLSCFTVSPNGCWAAGGSPNGQVYLWELASGLLLSSFTAHYRSVTSLKFTPDSHLLLSASHDSSIHIYLVSRLVDDDDPNTSSKPYGVLGDHTLGINSVAVGKTAGSSGGRCWSASEDGTVKMWSLHPPFDLLCTFSLPPSAIPGTLAVDPFERFFYVATKQGEVFHVPMFKRRGELGSRDWEAVGGGGLGAAPMKLEGSVINSKSPITTMALSLSSSHLLVGTQSGEIHVYSLPSHQLLRTISSHASPVTHLSTMLRPPDLVGSRTKLDSWPIMEVKPLERTRGGRIAREVQEVSVVLVPTASTHRFEQLRPPRTQLVPAGGVEHDDQADRVQELEAENKRLRANLDRAVRINEKMWSGVVELKLAEPITNGQAR